jgi:hypothetical protein
MQANTSRLWPDTAGANAASQMRSMAQDCFGLFATEQAGLAFQLMSASLQKRPDCCAHAK